MSDPQDTAKRNQQRRARAVERLLRSIDPQLQEHAYPVRSEDLAAYYGSSEMDLPNETESLGDVFDRLADEYDTPQEARAAVLKEITGADFDPAEFNPERDLDPERAGELGSVADVLDVDPDEPPIGPVASETDVASDDAAWESTDGRERLE